MDFMTGDRWRGSYDWNKTLDDSPKIEALSSKDTPMSETIMIPWKASYGYSKCGFSNNERCHITAK